jgi:hypothetical protein
MHAERTDNSVVITEPINHEVRFSLVERDGEQFAKLDPEDLAAMWEALPNGASPTERGDIECYLCGVAEAGDP